MRIAILADPLDNQSAGVHVFVREMIHALLRNDADNEYILVRLKKDRQFDDYPNVRQYCIPTSTLPIGVSSVRLFLLIPLLLNLKRVDVVIEPAHFGPFNLLPRIRRVTIIHDLTPILFPELHRWHSQFLQNRFLRGILYRTDLIIANSDNTANDVAKTYPDVRDKVHRIYPGGNERFAFREDAALLDKYGVRTPYFLFVGTIEPRKNLLVLLEAFRIFKERTREEAQLVIVGGNGWKSEAFFAALEQHPFKEDILRPGFVVAADLPALYSSAVAFVYPSKYEGFGLPILEAASCGTAVITADNSSLPEAAGPGALFFPTADYSSLADCMETLYRDADQRKRLGDRGLTHAKRFSWDNFAAQFLELLEPGGSKRR
jgi:glycosyltransferase involved in cell wall biosynthesis